MTCTNERSATLVVIEFGAAWPRWLPAGHSSHVACVAQHYEGEPRSLITQVASRLTRLEATGWRFSEVVFSLNSSRDPDTAATRAVVSRGLLSRLGRGTKLVLSAACTSTMTSSLRGLAARLDEDARRAGVTLCLIDGGPSNESTAGLLARSA
jgi:hypothetical protein